MNLAQLTYFCHLAKTEHYTRSAESLHVSQSALSTPFLPWKRNLDAGYFVRRDATCSLPMMDEYS